MVSFHTHLGWCVIMTVKSEFGYTFLHAVRFTQNEIIPIKSVILLDSNPYDIHHLVETSLNVTDSVL